MLKYSEKSKTIQKKKGKQRSSIVYTFGADGTENILVKYFEV